MGKRILVVPSNEIGWHAVVRALERLPCAVTVAPAGDLERAAELAARKPPDAVVMAWAADPERGLRAIARLRRHLRPACPIAVIGKVIDPPQVLALRQLEVRGFLLWDELTADLLAPSLAAFVGGMTVASPSLGNVGPAPDVAPLDPGVLTEREHQVLRNLGEGLGEEQIASVQHLSVRSVRRAIASAKEKLGASTMFLLGRASVQIAPNLQPELGTPRRARP